MRNKGFTLMEVIISVLLVTVISAGVFGAFKAVQYIFNRSMHKMQAFNFAKEALDRLRSNYNYNSSPQMDTGTNKPESDIGSIVRGEITNFNTVLTYDVSEPQPDGYKEVGVSVTWTERGG